MPPYIDVASRVLQDSNINSNKNMNNNNRSNHNNNPSGEEIHQKGETLPHTYHILMSSIVFGADYKVVFLCLHFMLSINCTAASAYQ